jgi:hypothetical protein
LAERRSIPCACWSRSPAAVDAATEIRADHAAGGYRFVAGEYVRASTETVSNAAAATKDMPKDFRLSITNAPGKNGAGGTEEVAAVALTRSLASANGRAEAITSFEEQVSRR